MKREDLEQYLGEIVEVKLFDGSVYIGCLRKSHDKIFINDANLYIPVNYYFVTVSKELQQCASCLFKTSHVKKIKLRKEIT